MEIFVHQQNLLYYRRQLADTADDARRQELLKLLAHEEAKAVPPAQEKEK